jgi:deazaflavin-dependent oxidoreductase (nitroreductase family)
MANLAPMARKDVKRGTGGPGVWSAPTGRASRQAASGRISLRSLEVDRMPNYIPSPRDWVREQVELYESSGGTKGTTLRDTGLPVILVTHIGNKTGAIRKTPLMRVKDGDTYVLVGSVGGAPKDPVWVHNLRANPKVKLRDETVVRPMHVREVADQVERERLWKLAVAAFPPYADYQAKTERQIPIFVATPAG